MKIIQKSKFCKERYDILENNIVIDFRFSKKSILNYIKNHNDIDMIGINILPLEYEEAQK